MCLPRIQKNEKIGLLSGIDPVQIGMSNGVNRGAFCGMAIVAYVDLRRLEAQHFHVPDLEKVTVVRINRPSVAVQGQRRPE